MIFIVRANYNWEFSNNWLNPTFCTTLTIKSLQLYKHNRIISYITLLIYMCRITHTKNIYIIDTIEKN